MALGNIYLYKDMGSCAGSIFFEYSKFQKKKYSINKKGALPLTQKIYQSNINLHDLNLEEDSYVGWFVAYDYKASSFKFVLKQ